MRGGVGLVPAEATPLGARQRPVPAGGLQHLEQEVAEPRAVLRLAEVPALPVGLPLQIDAGHDGARQAGRAQRLDGERKPPLAVEDLHKGGNACRPRLDLADLQVELVQRAARGNQRRHSARGEVGEPLRLQAHSRC